MTAANDPDDGLVKALLFKNAPKLVKLFQDMGAMADALRALDSSGSATPQELRWALDARGVADVHVPAMLAVIGVLRQVPVEASREVRGRPGRPTDVKLRVIVRNTGEFWFKYTGQRPTAYQFTNPKTGNKVWKGELLELLLSFEPPLGRRSVLGRLITEEFPPDWTPPADLVRTN